MKNFNIYDDNIICTYISYKTNKLLNNNIVVFIVKKRSNKIEISKSLFKLFNLNIKKINTIIVKGKKKIKNKIVGYRKNWKKAYITLNKVQYKKYIEQIKNLKIINKNEYY